MLKSYSARTNLRAFTGFDKLETGVPNEQKDMRDVDLVVRHLEKTHH